MTDILWVSKETPDRHGQGGQRRQFFQIRELVRSGASVAAVLAHGGQDPSSIAAYADVRFFGGRWSPFRSRVSPVSEALSGRYARIVIAHAESFELLEACAVGERPPSLLDFHNVNSRWYRTLMDPLRTEYWDRSEAAIMATVELALTCSSQESLALPLGQNAPVVAANGVDLEEWPSRSASRQPHRLVAFGSWWYPSNRKGLEWFLSTVWPLIRERVPEAQLLLAGSGVPPLPPQGVEGVEHVGRVADIAAFLQAATVVVMPVIESPGTPVKFAEVLAVGTPLVATPSAGEGFPDSPAVLTDDPLAFADACLRFLRSVGAASQAAHDGRAFAEAHCQWSRTQLPLLTWADSGLS